MRTYAASATIEEAFDRTVQLLWPPSKGVWFRIAIIALFLGGGMINPVGTERLQWTGVGAMLPGSDAASAYLTLIMTILTGILLAGLVYIIISAIFQFIFVDCLSTGTILLTRTFRLRWRKGIHLVGLYVFLLIIILISTFAVIMLIMIPPLLTGRPDFITTLVLLIESLIVLLIVLIPVWIIAILTADFVVPVMIVDDDGIIAGWKQVMHIFQGRWIEAAIYTAFKIGLTIIAGIILGMILFIISIPLGLTAAALSIEEGITPEITSTDVIVIGCGTVAMFLISLLLLVPVITFFRYYSLAVLRDLDGRYTLLPERKTKTDTM